MLAREKNLLAAGAIMLAVGSLTRDFAARGSGKDIAEDKKIERGADNCFSRSLSRYYGQANGNHLAQELSKGAIGRTYVKEERQGKSAGR